ncbi:MAG: N-acetylmuramoyl-L-alanine amidase [Methylococcales bacterium]
MNDFPNKFSQCVDDPQQCINGLNNLLLNSYLSPWEDQRDYANRRGRDRAEGRIRTRTEITGIVLHSTGRHHFRDSEGWVSHIRANFIIPHSGIILYCHDVLEERASSGRLNRTTVPVEFIGNFRMTNGNWFKRSLHAGHNNMPSDGQYRAGRRLIRFLKDCYGITEVWAHTQASQNREDCPGMDIWGNVGQWAIDQNILTEGDGSHLPGNPIPDQWRNPLPVGS